MQSGNMDGLFQVEGSLYVSLFKRLPPKQLLRRRRFHRPEPPGPLESGMVDDYTGGQPQRTRPPHYYDDRLRPILEETHGTMVYQEQIMQISMVMSGFSAGKSDKLRKAMGKKKLDVMRAAAGRLGCRCGRERLRPGSRPTDMGRRREVREVRLQQVAFGGLRHPRDAHGLPEGALPERLHGRCAAPATWATPTASSATSPAATRTARRCCRRTSTSSRAEFTPVEGGIRFGLVGVRGVGKNVADEIIAEREANGPFTSLHDFVNRLGCEVLQPQDARGPHQGRRLRLHRLHPQAAHVLRGGDAAA
ncbi:MAG: hypothetical protein ACLTDR_12200 [Adlercreutzia equolifaciens]